MVLLDIWYSWLSSSYMNMRASNHDAGQRSREQKDLLMTVIAMLFLRGICRSKLCILILIKVYRQHLVSNITLRKMHMLIFLQALVFSQLMRAATVQVTVEDVIETSTEINSIVTNSSIPSTLLLPTSPVVTSLSSAAPIAPASDDLSSSSTSSNDFQIGPIIGESIGGAVALGGFITITLLLRRTSKRLGWPGNSSYDIDTERGHGGHGPKRPTRPPPLTSLGKQRATNTGDGDEVYMLQTMGYRDYNIDHRDGRNYGTLNSSHSLTQSESVAPDMQSSTPEVGMSRSHTRMGPRPNPRLCPKNSNHHCGESGSSKIDVEALAKEVAKILMQPPTPSSLGGETVQVEHLETWKSDKMGYRICNQEGPEDNAHTTGNPNGGLSNENLSGDSHSTAPPLYQIYHSGSA
ncbi:hypothetical protein DFJ43DRAFT_1159103 [Lentinula guzmanii]|uniref:Uncharacterized protein n=1 Tax=Lentinula guzmanii TaxID=2804957 RepID=A0AA38J4D2_9AGAR|nr:hypothetical protein DFJ43DRAFT_1159103 [Lentinula guzmanii]